MLWVLSPARARGVGQPSATVAFLQLGCASALSSIAGDLCLEISEKAS